MLDTKSLSEQIEKQLKQEIMSGDLEPGQRLTIECIAERLEVSTMPVRDAVRRLDGLGFLKVAPRRGVFVEEFDQNRFKNIMEIRIALEGLAVELAATRIPQESLEDAKNTYRRAGDHYARVGDLSRLAECDNLIHDLIINCSRNPLLIEMMRQLQDLIDWAHQIVAKYRPGAQVDALPEHLAIIDALRRRDVAATKSTVRDHLLNTLDRTLLAWDHKTGAA